MDTLDKKILDIIQQGIPIAERPFQLIAQQVNATESEVLQRIHQLKHQGIIRRVGASFDSQRLGYRSILVAAKVAEDQLESTAAIINRYTGVTHNYQRDHTYNLWFTLTSSSENRLYELLEQLKQETGIDTMIPLPALKKFKIQVHFKMESSAKKE